MKKPNIKHLGLRFSAYSTRGTEIKRWKRAHKKNTTVIPVSILLATSIIPLSVTAFV